MTKREEEVLQLIMENPLISQKECSTKLGISRSAVAGHIMNLTEKGYIKGKGYILREDPYIVVIGGANMDISGSPTANFISRDSNPGTVTLSAGGVGRNIAENLARLGSSVKLLTLLGDDIYGKQLMSECRTAGIDMNYAITLDQCQTSTYLAILDEKKEMISAISAMSIMDHFDKSYIEKNHRVINGASLLIIDANLPETVIRYITDKYRHMDIFFDTVSTAKAIKIRENIGDFHTIKPNKIEAEILSGLSINSETDMKKAAEVLLNKGVERVFLTLGDKGIFYCDKDRHFIHKTNAVNAVNTTGAGDAFTAALAYSHNNGFSIEKTLRFASAVSELTVLNTNTINRDLTIPNIEKIMKERIDE